MGKQMIQQKGLIKTGVSWFSSQIKRFFKREDSEENKRNHLQDLYDKYEKQTRNHHRKAQSKSKLLTKDKSEVLQIVLKRLRSEGGLPQKYLTRCKKIKQCLDSREPFEKHNQLMCPICMEFFINPVPTACGHTFCYRCLDNALLFKGGCPVCRCYLRGQELSPCLAVNNIVRMHVRNVCKPQQIETYEARLHDTLDWQQKKRVPESMLVVGEKLDVRDTQYIWCKGFILNVYRKGDTVTELLIHYQGWNKIYDEILELSSPRLAPLGYFTSREDIPRYALNENHQTYYSYVQKYLIQVISGPPPQPMANEQQQLQQVEPEEADNVEQPEQPSAEIENSESQQQRSEIDLDNDLNNRLEEASRLVTNFNIAVSSLQERIMLRNILNDMGLNNIGNMINFNELGTGAGNQQQSNQQEIMEPNIDVQVNLMPRELIHPLQQTRLNIDTQDHRPVQPSELVSEDDLFSENNNQQLTNHQLPIEIRVLPLTAVTAQLQLLATTNSSEMEGQTGHNSSSTN